MNSWSIQEFLNALDINSPDINAACQSFINSSKPSSTNKPSKRQYTRAPDWAKADPVPKASRTSQHSRRRSSKSTPRPVPAESMDMDAEYQPPPQISAVYHADPRDQLHDALIKYLEFHIPPILDQTVNLLKSKQSQVPEKVQEDSSASIHARQSKKPTPHRKPTPKKINIPLESEYKSWHPAKALAFLSENPPPHVSNPKDIAVFASFVQDRRRGREFGRGDWQNAIVGMEALFGDPEFQFRLAVLEAFDRCGGV